jgi:hypothetical protein
MTEIHEDYGPSYPYSDFKKGDVISYRLEGHTEHGEILCGQSCDSRALYALRPGTPTRD